MDTPFKCLNQESYKDSSGKDIPSSKIQCLAPYKHMVDGFYNWECGLCGREHGSRSCGWPIAGQVLECDGCKAMNLLVKTNCEEIDKAFGLFIKMEERDKELTRLVNIEQELNMLKARLTGNIIQGLTERVHAILIEELKKP
jgi:hypothetical protein